MPIPQQENTRPFLPTGFTYGIRAEAENYYAISDHLEALDTTNDMRVSRDLELAPIEVGKSFGSTTSFSISTRTVLRPDRIAELDRVGQILKENKDISIAISGHTDNIGSDEANMALSDWPRQPPFRSIITHAGIDPNRRITAKGLGKDPPIATNETEEGADSKIGASEFAIVK